MKVAKEGILAYNLDRDPAIAMILERGSLEDPLFVERLDKTESAYYLVPWMTVDYDTLVVAVDAVNAVMLGTSTFGKSTPSPFLAPDLALECVAQEFPQHVFSKPRLVWKPCRESTSPFHPFYEITSDEGVLYVGMDGSIFRQLTSLGFGG